MSMRIGKTRFVWGIAFAYIAYSLVGDVPALAKYAAFSINVSALIFIIIYLIHSFTNLGIKTGVKYLAITTILGYSFEYLFINTGLIGHYTYSSVLAPFLGPIPVFIPLQWAALSYFCMIATDNYLISAGLMVLLDMSFDPKFSLTLWHWSTAGQYFGVPITNFVGWFVTSATIYGVFYLASRRKARSTDQAIVFYLCLGIADGALLYLNLGMYTLDAISIVLFGVGTALVYLYSRRVNRRPRVMGPQTTPKVGKENAAGALSS
jgi:putative membrane protein